MGTVADTVHFEPFVDLADLDDDGSPVAIEANRPDGTPAEFPILITHRAD